MNMDIKKKVLDMSTVYANLSHMETIHLLEDLFVVKYELEDCLASFRSDTCDMDIRLPEIMRIEEQMIYIDKNIRAVEDALLCHESKILNRFSVSGEIHSVCLN